MPPRLTLSLEDGDDMLFRLIDWYLAKHGQRRAGESEPIVIRVPYEVEKRVEVPVEVIKEVPLFRVDREIGEAAVELVRAFEVLDEHSGEAKRHQVLARLIKKFPAAEKRDLALAIEYAIRSLDA